MPETGMEPRLVEACSDSDSPEKESWRIRKERYLEHLSHAPSDVRLISAADKLHNARAILADYRTLGEDLWKRFNASREDELWYYRGLVAALRQADTKTQARTLVDELEEVVTALERYTKSRDTSR